MAADRPGLLHAVAAGGAIFYLAVQTVQRILFAFVLPRPSSPLEELLLRQHPADAARALLLLASFFALVPVYVAVARLRRHRAPGAASCGVLSGLLFVAFELAYRSLDLFLVGGPWADAARASPSAAADILARVALWEQAVEAWYFPLLATHLASSTAFTIACWPRAGDDRWHWLAAASFGLNALRLAARLLGGYAGIAPLAAFSGALYFPAVALVTALLAVWLVRRSISG
jgi:hypothetical protein